MKFLIESAALKDAARFVLRMSPARPTQPILSGVLIHADAAEGVTFTVFNYERAAQTTADATIDDGGTVLVGARLLSSIADKLPSKPVTVELDGPKVRVKSGSVKFTLPLMPVDEYPRVQFAAEPVATMTGVEFEDAVSRVAPVASKDDVTPILQAVHVVVGDGVMFRATDRYRIAEAHAEADTVEECELLVPADVLADAAKSLTGKVTISHTGGDNPRTVISGDEGIMSTVQISGNYPPLERLMDAPMTHQSVINSEAMSGAVSRCAIVIERESALKFTFDQLALTIESINSDNSATETIDCDGDQITVALKPQFVIDGVKACRAELVRIEWGDTGNGKPGPVMFHGSHRFRYLLQPNLLLR